MKIGILTYHRAENYGGCLQAYALKAHFEKNGHTVSFVDYWPDYHAAHYSYFNFYELKRRNVKGKLVYILLTLFALPWLIRRRRNFRQFIKNNFNLPDIPVFRSPETYCREKYDAVIYGSDQIWRKQNLPGFESYDQWYFGSNHVVCKRKISYAASVGVLDRSEKAALYFKYSLKNFSAISVREQDLGEWISSLAYHADHVLDPVFLLEKKDWMLLCNQIPDTGKYILFYNLLQTSQSVALAKELAGKHGCCIKEITKSRDLHPNNARYMKSVEIGEFLSLVANAEFVVGNSFHGVAFSVIFEKEFYAVGMGDRSQRVVSLLSNLGIPERYSDDGRYTEGRIDYGVVRKRLEKLKTLSRDYLSASLK